MKPNYKNILLAFSIVAITFSVKAQTAQSQCGLYAQMQKMSHEDSAIYLQKTHALAVYTKNYIHNHRNKSSNDTVYYIPMVFHIIHDYGSADISDAQVLDEVNIINRDYRKQNADTAQIMNGFDSVAADVRIEFRLAKKDPQGNCTNGIDRVAYKGTYSADDYAKLDQWDPDKYLNVWVVKHIAIGAAGYCYYPGSVTGTRSWKDGVLILSNYIGSIGTSSPVTSRTLTHETGHYLNLEHVWGNTNAPGVACGDDAVYDTPVTKGFVTCTTNNAICDTNVHENINNYMDYSYCSMMFTQGQKLRMRATLTAPIAHRNNLITAQTHTFTGIFDSTASPCAPKADFSSNYKFICKGGSVQFTDRSFNGTVTSRSWLFDGGTPASDTASTVSVTFNTPGWHAVSLSVSNAQGSDTKIDSTYIYVSSDTAAFQAPYSYSFEDKGQFDSLWISTNPYIQDSHWAIDTMGAATGSKSVWLENYYYGQPGVWHDLILPSIDVSALTPPYYLHFKYAYATRANSLTDAKEQLNAYCSKDCGKSWIPLVSLSGADLVTAGTFATSTYIAPKPADWKEYISGLPVSPTHPIMIKFEYRSTKYSNNIYLDDININTDPLSVQSIKNVLTTVNIFPNPADNKANVVFHLSEKSNISMQLIDFSGRIVRNYNQNKQNQGDVNIPIDCNNLSAGIYMVKLTTGKSVVFKKLVIK